MRSLVSFSLRFFPPRCDIRSPITLSLTYQLIAALYRAKFASKPLGAATIAQRSFFLSTAPSAAMSPRLGQPSPLTHPHILKKGEITPFANLEEYKLRRERFMEKLPEGSVAVLPAAKHYYMTNDIPYVYRQNNDFSYLTGFAEPGTVMVLHKHQGATRFILFVRERNEHSELWDGPRTGVERAPQAFGCDEAYDVKHLSVILPDILENPATKQVFWRDIETDVSDYKKALDEVNHVPKTELKGIMNRIRLVKTPAEIKMMRKSCSISANAFIETMKATTPTCSEHDMSAKIEYECRIRGSQRLAYPPVVATGISCNTLHYVMNDSFAEDGDLLLMDAGGEYFDYASDITRTWPTNGKFTEGQRAIYEAVLRTQERIIQNAKTHWELDSGKTTHVTLAKLQAVAMESTMHELKALGITEDPRRLTEVYPHMIGHFLGMDVHDVPSIGYHEPLQPGMIITVEPGLYMPDEEWVPKAFRGVGVRIEDDVLITETEPEVLTREAPKAVQDLERIIGTNAITFVRHITVDFGL